MIPSLPPPPCLLILKHEGTINSSPTFDLTEIQYLLNAWEGGKIYMQKFSKTVSSNDYSNECCKPGWTCGNSAGVHNCPDSRLTSFTLNCSLVLAYWLRHELLIKYNPLKLVHNAVYHITLFSPLGWVYGIALCLSSRVNLNSQE